MTLKFKEFWWLLDINQRLNPSLLKVLMTYSLSQNVGNVEVIGVHVTALQTITIVGGVVSIVCLFLTVVGLAKFKLVLNMFMLRFNVLRFLR